jgi:hypothetical protein
MNNRETDETRDSGDVGALTVLDAGCGTGYLSAWSVSSPEKAGGGGSEQASAKG